MRRLPLTLDAIIPIAHQIRQMLLEESRPYILDVTLTQFEPYLERPISPVVFLPQPEAESLYYYRPGGYGRYVYAMDDIRPSLLAKISTLR